MLTVVCDTPGTLRAEERPMPSPAAGEVLLRVRRVGVCGTDLHIFTRPPALPALPEGDGPRAVGDRRGRAAGSRLAEGDMVYVMPYLSCGHCVACRQGKTNCCVSCRCSASIATAPSPST